MYKFFQIGRFEQPINVQCTLCSFVFLMKTKKWKYTTRFWKINLFWNLLSISMDNLHNDFTILQLLVKPVDTICFPHKHENRNLLIKVQLNYPIFTFFSHSLLLLQKYNSNNCRWHLIRPFDSHGYNAHCINLLTNTIDPWSNLISFFLVLFDQSQLW